MTEPPTFVLQRMLVAPSQPPQPNAPAPPPPPSQSLSQRPLVLAVAGSLVPRDAFLVVASSWTGSGVGPVASPAGGVLHISLSFLPWEEASGWNISLARFPM